MAKYFEDFTDPPFDGTPCQPSAETTFSLSRTASIRSNGSSCVVDINVEGTALCYAMLTSLCLT
jgi:hypothetical protein